MFATSTASCALKIIEFILSIEGGDSNLSIPIVGIHVRCANFLSRDIILQVNERESAIKLQGVLELLKNTNLSLQ